MRINWRSSPTTTTHEGGPAYPHLTDMQALRRSVLSCLLWEREFYEDGVEIADRITELAEKVPPFDLGELAFEARTRYHLRHVPLLLLTVLAKTGSGNSFVSEAIASTISRADELTELLAIYWRKGRTPLSAQLKKGLASAFKKFDAHQLAKYNRDEAIKLRDVLFLVHARPKNSVQDDVWKRLVNRTLESPDTWEVNLSGGKDKRESFERLMNEGKLGYLALLRNLRNMEQAGVNRELIEQTIRARRGGADKVLPFRYVAALRAAPSFADVLNAALLEAIDEQPTLPGSTVVLVDVSGSMTSRLSARSEMDRMDAAATLASMINGKVRMFSFSNGLQEVPPWRGMPGIEAIRVSQPHGGTYLGRAVEEVSARVPADRIIVVTDEQVHDRIPYVVPYRHRYMINVASARNGVGYGPWTHIDGFSEQALRFIHERESAESD